MTPDQIKKEIREACPYRESKDREFCVLHKPQFSRTDCKRCLARPVRIGIADVLLAIGLERFHNNDDIPELIYGYRHSWNLRRDSLDDQSPETLKFIHSLVGGGENKKD